MNPLGFGDPLRLGPYRLLGVLGEGGMGKVYLAAAADGRPAAVKVLRPELAHDQNLAQRFVREAHTAQAVRSRGVARVLDAQMEGGRPWIATEYLAGPTLDQAVTRYGPFDEATVRALAAALGETLRDIHAAGLIHRDIKPPNIVLTSDGPRVIDFGIARPEHGLTLTTTGQIPVTPGYGAPEQVLGGRVTGAADVFSLGAVLVYAATGRRAYDGAHVAAVQYAVVHGQPDLAALPPALHQLIAPCLAREPEFRPTPEQVTHAFLPDRRKARDVWRRGPLQEEVERRETEVRRQAKAAASTVVAGAPAPSRRRVLAAWGGGGALLLAGGGGTAWWLGNSQENTLPPAGDAPEARLLDRANAGIRPTPLWGPVDAAASGPLPPPVALRDVVVFPDRNGGLTALKVVDGSTKWTLPDISKVARQLPLTRTEFAAASPSGHLVVHDASTSRRSWSLPTAEAAFLLAATPDTVYLLTTKGALRAVDVAGRTIRWTVASTEGVTNTRGPLAAAGTDHLVISGTDGTVTAYARATGRRAWEIRGQASETLQPAIDDGTVYLGGRTLTAVTLTTGKRLWSIDPSPQGTWGPPAVDATGVTATQGRAVRRFAKDGSSPDFWYADLNGDFPDLQPPVIQGDCVWTVESANGESGISGLSIPEGRRLWTYERDNTGPWAMTAKGNRVFLISKGKVAALPTF
ncbi:protein kinase [Streptomyces sp. NPDC094032]|uniref:protein kinase domain-containing protein n=1 Tax=Streptomyces sp. NPDC094032 TaxID=3155308 RepID=UPI00331BB3D9